MSDFPVCKYNNSDCLSDLHWYWSYDFGNCFQFNVGLNATNAPIKIQQSNRVGPDYGLRVGVVPLTNVQAKASYYASGMIIFVHNTSLRPLKSDGVFIKAGERTSISVKRTFISNVNSPYTACQDLTSYSSPLYDLIVNSKQYYMYRQQDCFNLCIQKSIISACNCSYSSLDNPWVINIHG